MGTKKGQMVWGKIIGDGIRRQMDAREGVEEKNEKYQPGMLIINGEKDEQVGHIQEIYYVDSFGDYWDEITHRKLERKEVQEARLEELRQVYQHKVYMKVPIQQCWDETGMNPISVRWLDINKGDEDDHDVWQWH